MRRTSESPYLENRSFSIRPMSFKCLLVICLSIGLTSEPFIDLFSSTGTCPVVWTSMVSGVDSLGISADGNYVSVGSIHSPIGGGPSGNGTVTMFASNSSRPIWTYATGFTLDGPVRVSMSENGAYLSTGGDVLRLRSLAVLGRASSLPLWTLNTPVYVNTSFVGFGAFATSAVSGDGEYVAVHELLPVHVGFQGGVLDSIAMFRRAGMVPLWFHNITHDVYPGPGPAPISLSYEGAYLATIDPDTGILYFFSQHDNQTLWTRTGSWLSVQISRTGDFVAAANGSSISIFGKDSNSTLLSTAFPTLHLGDFSRDGSTIALITGYPGTIDATLRLYDRLSGKELFSANPITADSYQQLSGLETASTSGDGSRTALVTLGGGLFVYDRSGGLICSARQGNVATTVAISGDGRFVITGGSQLTYMAVASPNQTLYILPIVAGTVVAVVAAFLIFRKRRLHRRVGSAQESLPTKPMDFESREKRTNLGGPHQLAL